MPCTTEETFRRLLDLLLTKDMNAVADLWAQPEPLGSLSPEAVR
ncbi:hypothetical protein [Streptosporangium sp. NPDC002524]